MKRKIITAIALFTVFISIFGTALKVTPIRAEEPPEPILPRIEGTGTYLEINNSKYLNVSITSSKVVYMLITVPGDMVDCGIESASEANSTTLTFNNLKPNFTYYMFEDGYVNEKIFDTDSLGSYTYTQDISKWHHIFIQEHSSTVIIYTDTVLTYDILDTVEIGSSNIVLDLNGHYISTMDWIGIDISGKTNVTIKNGSVKKCWLAGIYMDGCTFIKITNVTIDTIDYIGVDYMRSNNNTLTKSTINECGMTGIEFLVSAFYNTIVNNTIQNNRNGLSLQGFHTVRTTVYHNNFIDNSGHVSGALSALGIWDDSYPSGGNYWSGVPKADVKKGANQDQPGSDGINDTRYRIEIDEFDRYPLVYPYGSAQPPMHTLTIQSTPVGVAFTVTNIPRTTPWLELYTENALVNLEMPAVHAVGEARYYWNQWSDTVTSRSRTVTISTDTTLTGIFTGPYYQLNVTTTPITGIPFTVNGNPKTTPYSEWLPADYYILNMPATHDGYVWSRWLEDGDTQRIKVVSLPTHSWTALYAVETSTGSGTVTFTQDAGTVADLIAVDEATLPPEGKPDLEFPHGFFSFNVTGLTPGQAVSLTITFPTNMPVGTQYWKCQAGVWSRIPVGDDDGDKVLVITLTDGWIGDADGVANGRINDPGGFGVPPPPAPVGGFSCLAGGYSTEKTLALYLGIVAVLAMTSAITRRKAHRETKQS